MDDLIERQKAIFAILECCDSDYDSEYECGYDDGLRQGVHRLKHLPSAQQWIPVTERLPEDMVDVLVTDDSGGLATIATDCMFTKEDTGERDWLASQRITAWMPLQSRIRRRTMADLMTFPNTVEEFMEKYKIVDTEQVYTNGAELVPIFRMKQWFEHLPTADVVEVVRCKDCKYWDTEWWVKVGDKPYCELIDGFRTENWFLR